ncbi:MAG: prephenate dehydratase [Thermoleophilaceae bacterium]|jgi:prephenate dehydratase|nr:prephenate dehydratase [Thermoleophilaceae bacterium]
MRVGYLGPAGTYSEEALRASAPEGVEAVPYPFIYDAVMAVQEGEVDRAVVPIENSLEGAVSVTLDTLALEASGVRIVAEVVHPIHHCVVAARQLELSEVTRVISHPQATAQCRRFLREHLRGAERAIAPSTADAVLSVCNSTEPIAALGSRLAAELYGCTVLAADVEDHPDNATRFVWLAPEDDAAQLAPGGKASLVFWGSGDESPGWLVHALREFSDRGVNLTRIESRPRRTSLGHYMFFVDLQGGVGDELVDEALGALRTQVEELRILGSYTSAPGSARLH